MWGFFFTKNWGFIKGLLSKIADFWCWLKIVYLLKQNSKDLNSYTTYLKTLDFCQHFTKIFLDNTVNFKKENCLLSSILGILRIFLQDLYGFYKNKFLKSLLWKIFQEEMRGFGDSIQRPRFLSIFFIKSS